MKKQTNHPSHKRLYIIITLVGIVLIALIARILYYNYDQQQLASLHKDIQSTRTSLGVIAHNLEGQTKTSWSDVSECYRTEPRLFGDEYKYDCDVRYITEVNGSMIEHFQQIISKTIVNGSQIKFTGPSSDSAGMYTSYAATIGVNEGYDTEKNCSLEYSYEHANGQIEGWLMCHYSLTKSQFDAVSGVLPAGNDRT